MLFYSVFKRLIGKTGSILADQACERLPGGICACVRLWPGCARSCPGRDLINRVGEWRDGLSLLSCLISFSSLSLLFLLFVSLSLLFSRSLSPLSLSSLSPSLSSLSPLSSHSLLSVSHAHSRTCTHARTDSRTRPSLVRALAPARLYRVFGAALSRARASVIIELKNDLALRGTLHSVDQVCVCSKRA